MREGGREKHGVLKIERDNEREGGWKEEIGIERDGERI